MRSDRAGMLGAVAIVLGGGVLGGCVLGGCGHGGGAARAAEAAPASGSAPAPAPRATAPRDDEMVVKGGLGTLSPEGVDAAIAAQRPAIDECYRRAVGQKPYLGGSMSFKVRVGVAGAVTAAFTVEPLGSLEVEECVLDVTRAMRLPRPEGGQAAEFTETLDFHGTMAVDDLAADAAHRVYGDNQRTLRACGRPQHAGAGSGSPSPSPVRLVVLVAPGGVAGSLGVGADESLEPAYVRCVASAVRKWKFPDPHGRVTRATYHLQEGR